MQLRRGTKQVFTKASVICCVAIVATCVAPCHYAFVSSPRATRLSPRLQRGSHTIFPLLRRRKDNVDRSVGTFRKYIYINPFMNRPYRWEGDDLRWTQKMRRRLAEAMRALQPVKTTVMLANIVLFLYQVINATQYIRRKYPSHWPQDALAVIFDTLLGAWITGPLTMDFVFSNGLSQVQPHRYLTSGFLHGSLIHLYLNMDSLRHQPSWLETGLGWPLYLTAYLVSIVTGNLGHAWLNKNDFDVICLGASGGICGLYGLMFSALAKMGNSKATSLVAMRMGLLFLSGVFFENVSNAAHVGGFLGGLLIGLVFGPNYRKSYAMRRKWSVEVDSAPKGYRDVMGFGNMPTSSGTLPVLGLWAAALLTALTQPKLRSIPSVILSGLLRPGSLSRSF